MNPCKVNGKWIDGLIAYRWSERLNSFCYQYTKDDDWHELLDKEDPRIVELNKKADE